MSKGSDLTPVEYMNCDLTDQIEYEEKFGRENDLSKEKISSNLIDSLKELENVS